MRRSLNAAALAAAFFFSGTVLAQASLEKALAPERGDVERGRRVVQDHAVGGCVLCHALPRYDGPAGNLAPSLEGVGRRLNAAQLRLRIVDSTRINPETIMPAYHRTEGLERVGAAYRGKPILNAQQVEDVVAYLQTLK